MAYDYPEKIDPVDPVFTQGQQKTEEVEDMKSEYTAADRLTLDIDCRPLGPSNCPSMASGFSPLESPTPTPTSTYHGQPSLESPGAWSEAGPFQNWAMDPAHPYDAMRGGCRVASIGSVEGPTMQFPQGERQDGMSMFDLGTGYGETVEDFFVPSNIPKNFEENHSFPYQQSAFEYPHVLRNMERHPHQHPNYQFPASNSNPCLSRPIFQQHERLPVAHTTNNLAQWSMPNMDTMSPQTIQPSEAFPQAPMTPPSAYASGLHASTSTVGTHTPRTPILKSSPMARTPSAAGTPMTHLSNSGTEYNDEDFDLSPGFQNSLLRRRASQRRPSAKKSNIMKQQVGPKQSFKLENLPSIIRQVQFRCKEPDCKGKFKRQEHLKRHMKSHSKEKPHVCWVPGCGRGFSRSDNLNAHYTKTHSKRGGRNRYVATLDETSPYYDPDFRGQLTPEGLPIRGSRLEDPSMDNDDGESIDAAWDD